MTSRSFVKSLILVAFAVFLLFGTMTVTFLYGSNLEGRFFPVVKDGFVRIIKEDSTSVIFAAGGNKVRSCAYIGSTAIVFRNGEWHKAELKIEPRWLTTSTTGVQTFGIYEVMDTNWERLQLVARHDCHSLWTTVSVWVDKKRSEIEKLK